MSMERVTSGQVRWGDDEKNGETKILRGFLVGMRPKLNNKSSHVLCLQGSDDRLSEAFSCTVLNRALLNAEETDIKSEFKKCWAEIHYLGLSKNAKHGQSPAKLFDVWIDRSRKCKKPLPF